MPQRRHRPPRSSATTRLAALRLQAGLTQRQMAELTGLSPEYYWDLEHDRISHNINLRALVNCAAVLRVGLDDVIEDHWRNWHIFDQRRPRPPTDDELEELRR